MIYIKITFGLVKGAQNSGYGITGENMLVGLMINYPNGCKVICLEFNVEIEHEIGYPYSVEREYFTPIADENTLFRYRNFIKRLYILQEIKIDTPYIFDISFLEFFFYKRSNELLKFLSCDEAMFKGNIIETLEHFKCNIYTESKKLLKEYMEE